jgi:hypothetical protein
MSEHVIRLIPHYIWNGEDDGAFALYCSCGKFLMQDVTDPTELQKINAVAMEHLAPSMTARAVVVPLEHLIDGEQMRERLWQIADVPAQGYVHGLDPAEEDPRRGVLE